MIKGKWKKNKMFSAPLLDRFSPIFHGVQICFGMFVFQNGALFLAICYNLCRAQICNFQICWIWELDIIFCTIHQFVHGFNRFFHGFSQFFSGVDRCLSSYLLSILRQKPLVRPLQHAPIVRLHRECFLSAPSAAGPGANFSPENQGFYFNDH